MTEQRLLVSSNGRGRTLKAYRTGTHRALDPEVTIARVRPWLARMGITRIAHVTGLDTIGIPVVIVCRPNSRSLSVSQGKGVSRSAAIASGLMESIEFYHAERIALPLRLGSYADLCTTASVVTPSILPQISVSQFHPEFRLLWVESADLMQQDAKCWVPFELVHTDYTLPLPPGSGCFPMNSNGLASGNCQQEAFAHAICEVVERDALSVFRASGPMARSLRRLDLETVDDPVARMVLDQFRAAHVAVAVWDITSDAGLPAFECHIVDEKPNALRSLYANAGMGCHLTREIALLRALTEAAQGRLTRISSSRDDIRRDQYEEAQDPDVLAKQRREILEQPMRVRFRDVPSHHADTFEEDVAMALRQLRQIGITQVLAVDLTREEFGIPVVRVIIPGLEPTYNTAGYVPGPRAIAAAERGSALGQGGKG